ncbi:MAG: hypothetical protein H6739_22805 [Alphaproteobacteria bacterium]|nr:hypothetical protein [Alphaproteobacteria bacterium]
MDPHRARRIARALFTPARALARALPEPARRAIDDRLFYAIFNLTRVTNDAYPPKDASPGAATASEPTG